MRYHAAFWNVPEIPDVRDVAHHVDDDDGHGTEGPREAVRAGGTGPDPSPHRQAADNSECGLHENRAVRREPASVHVPEGMSDEEATLIVTEKERSLFFASQSR